MAGTMNHPIDAAYWVTHCQGFRVREGRTRLGFVESVLDDGRTLAVRRGILGREIRVSAADVVAVVPREMRLWLRAGAPAEEPRPATVPLELSRRRLGRRRAGTVAA